MRLPTRTLPYVLGQLAIGVWLVTASRVLCAAGVSLSGVLDDASFVLLLGALQFWLPTTAFTQPNRRVADDLRPPTIDSDWRGGSYFSDY